MTSERTADINALTALLRVLNLGIDARKPLTGKQITEVVKWRTRTEDIAAVIARAEAVRLAKRIVVLDDELAENVKAVTWVTQAESSPRPARQARHRRGDGSRGHDRRGRTTAACTPRLHLPLSQASAQSLLPQETPCVTASTAAATDA